MGNAPTLPPPLPTNRDSAPGSVVRTRETDPGNANQVRVPAPLQPYTGVGPPLSY